MAEPLLDPPGQQAIATSDGRVSRPWLLWFTSLKKLVIASISYQIVQSDEVDLPPEGKLNFYAPLHAADDAGVATDVTLLNSGVTPGSYAAANITVDQWGRVTAAADGASGVTATVYDMTGGRAFNTPYTNTTGAALYISGWGSTAGSSTGDISVAIGPSAPSLTVWANKVTATVSGGAAGFVAMVPAGFVYQVNVGGAVGGSPAKWIETQLG